MKKPKAGRKIAVFLMLCMFLCSILAVPRNVWAEPASGNVTVMITTDRDSYQTGDAIEATLSIENHSTEPIRNLESDTSDDTKKITKNAA